MKRKSVTSIFLVLLFYEPPIIPDIAAKKDERW